jgi:BetI-type transcriptional repressor, C-terminal
MTAAGVGRGLYAVPREVAGGRLAFAGTPELGLELGAHGLGQRTARSESASARAINGERPCVGVLGIVEQRVRRPVLDHCAQTARRLLRSALEYVGEKAATYTETDHAATGRDALLESLTAEIQDDSEIRENNAAWGEFRDLAVFDRSLGPTLFRATERWIDDISRLIRRGQEDGSIASDLSAESAGHQLTALTEGLSTRWLAGFLTTKQARAELRQNIERCLGPPPAFDERPSPSRDARD